MEPSTYARLTRLALWALAVIVVSGAAVRLTGSGLGCSDWPTCEEDSLIVPFEYHALVEFANRLFTGVVAAAVIGAVLGSLRRKPRRGDLIGWSFGLVAGVVGQVVLGALLVRAELDPRFVMGHFLLSMILLWNATILDLKARSYDAVTDLEARRHDTVADFKARSHDAVTDLEARRHDSVTDPKARSYDSVTDRGLLDDRLSILLLRAVFSVGAVLIVTGTLVTGSGPHAGDTRAERLPLLVREVTRVHSIVAIGLLVLVGWAWWRLRSRHPSRARRLQRVAMLLVVQGTVGYTQYFAGVPALLVGLHVLLASVTWIEIVRVTHLDAGSETRAGSTDPVEDIRERMTGESEGMTALPA